MNSKTIQGRDEFCTDLSVQNKTEQITLLSALINTLLSFTQVIVGYFAHSNALIADGVHTLSDLVADFVILFVNRKSHQAADAEHLYGHARFENAASFFFGFILLAVGLGILISALYKISTNNAIQQVHMIALIITCCVLLIKEGLFRYIKQIAKKFNSALLEINAWHARSDAATSFVVLCGIAGNLMGYPFLDPIAALLVGTLIMRTGGRIAWSGLADLTDHALPSQEMAAIEKTLTSVEGVRSIHNLRSRKMGQFAMIDTHIEVDPRISITEGHYIALEAEKLIQKEFTAHEILIHVDPYDENRSIQPDLPQRQTIDKIITPILSTYQQKNWHYTIHYVDYYFEIILTLNQPLNKLNCKQLILKIKNGFLVQPTVQLLFRINHS
jgi:cation diffusion facilitator family transporter